jgi:hypothetical protein
MIKANNPGYRAALAMPHAAYARVEVWRNGVPVEELNRYDVYPDAINRKVPVFLSGSVRCTLQSRVARTASITVPEWLYPFEPDDLLNPYGNHLKMYRGIRYGSGDVDEFPVFSGPITKVSPRGNGTATVEAKDLAGKVVGAGFAAPARAGVGSLVTAEFKRLVEGAYPLATFGPFDAITETVPELSYDTDRGAALDGLAKIASSFWYPLADGRFVMRLVPWTVTPSIQPLVLASGAEGTAVDGTLISAYPVRSEEGVYSEVVVSSENTDGGDPFSAAVRDLDPASPTYVNGAFGRKTLQLRVTQAPSQNAAYTAAKTTLRQSKALSESLQITCIADASIELGDVLEVHYRGHTWTQIAAGFSMPLDPGDTMQIDGRGLVTGGSEDIDV